MHCKIDGCAKIVHYPGKQLCQMHYFRHMRYGTYELTRKPGREKFTRDDGYVEVKARGHKFSRDNGYAFEHRIVAYTKYGDILPDCEYCKKPLDWTNAVVDHIDEVRNNNHPDNLRPLCSPCNIARTVRLGTSYPNATAVELDGAVMTPTEWSRVEGVKVHGATIRARIAKGMSPREAIYGRKITHNGNKIKKPYQRKTEFLHQRKNSVNIAIDGELKTANEWSRDPRCVVSDATLRNRVHAGWPHDLKILARIKP